MPQNFKSGSEADLTSGMKHNDLMSKRSFAYLLSAQHLTSVLSFRVYEEATRMMEIAGVVEKISNMAITQASIASEVVLVATGGTTEIAKHLKQPSGTAALFRPILAGVDVVKNPDTSSLEYKLAMNNQSAIDFPTIGVYSVYSGIHVNLGWNSVHTQNRFKKWKAKSKKKGSCVRKFSIIEFSGDEYLVTFRYATPMEAILKEGEPYLFWNQWCIPVADYNRADDKLAPILETFQPYIAAAGIQRINLGFGSFELNDFFGTIPAAVLVYLDSFLPSIHSSFVNQVDFEKLKVEALEEGKSTNELIAGLSSLDPAKGLMSTLKKGVAKCLNDSATDPQQDNLASHKGITDALRVLVPSTMTALSSVNIRSTKETFAK